MKPLVLCSGCKNEIQWGKRFCNTCGQPVEWPSGSGPEEPRKQKPESSQARAEKSKQKSAPAVSWKMMLGFALFLVGGVVVLELLTGTSNVPTQPVSQQPQASGANLEAMNHLAELEQQVTASPDNSELRLHLANFAHDNRFYDKAIEHYREYLRSNPRDPDALVDLGICYNDTDNLEEAQTFMKQALEISPKHLLAHFNLGIVNLKAGDIEQSNEWFRKAVSLSPESEVGKRAQQLLEQHGALENPG